MPKRIQMSRQHPWRAQNPDAVIVDRRTKWGNPYVVHEHSDRCGEDLERCDIIHGVSTAEHAVRLFRYLYRFPVIGQPRVPSDDEIRAELAGKDLACWCPLDQPCHADVLLALANPSTTPKETR